MKLSKNEKLLLTILFVIVLPFAAVRFVVTPIYNNYTESQAEYERLVYEKELLDLKFQLEEVTRTGHVNAEKALEELKEDYPTMISNEEVDRILTGLCLQNKLNPVLLGISGATGSGKEKKTEEQTGQHPIAYNVVTATMNLHGDYDSLKGLISTVEDIDYIRITKVSFSYVQDTNTVGSPNISVFFEVTMLNDTKQAFSEGEDFYEK